MNVAAWRYDGQRTGHRARRILPEWAASQRQLEDQPCPEETDAGQPSDQRQAVRTPGPTLALLALRLFHAFRGVRWGGAVRRPRALGRWDGTGLRPSGVWRVEGGEAEGLF